MKKVFKKFLSVFFWFIFASLFCQGNVFGLSETENQSEKVSIVVPVYNTEKYLDECLESAENQTYKNLEIICVNDGSTDGSLTILENHAKKDERIVIISQENQGLSGARNTGMSVATGKYIYFLDSDDVLLPYAMEKAVELLEKHDADALNFGVEGVKYKSVIDLSKFSYNCDLPVKICSIKEGENPFDVFEARTLSVWSYVYRKSFLENNNLWFKREIRVNEDVLFTCLVKASLKSLIKDSNIGYVYRLSRPGSLMNMDYKNIARRFDSFLITIRELFLNKDRFKFNKSDEYLLGIALRLLSINMYDAQGKIKKEYAKKFYKEIYNNFVEKYNVKLNKKNAERLNELKKLAE